MHIELNENRSDRIRLEDSMSRPRSHNAEKGSSLAIFFASVALAIIWIVRHLF